VGQGVKLRVVSRYRNGEVEYRPGQEIDVATATGEFLLRDSPGSFALADDPEPEVRTVDRRARGGRVR